MMKSIIKGVWVVAILGFWGCKISLSGVQVPVDIDTFNVDYIVNNAELVIPSLSQEVTDQLIQRIQNETRLKLNTEKPDIEFSGEIITFRVSSEAPTAGQNATLNRLDMAVNVEFTNHKDEEANWTNKFSNFQNFDPSEDFDSVQEELTAVILRDIIEDIYQKAFTNW